jgi:hypothetical protein
MTARMTPLVRRLVVLLVVPAVLVVADVAANRTALKFLLLPPFGALAYLVFMNPAQIELNVRRVIVAPTASAALAWILANTVGYNVLSVGLATGGTMLIMWLLDAPMIVPPMALTLLTLLLHSEVRGKVGYIVSVFVFTLALYALHRLWVKIPFERPPSDAAGQTDQQLA